MRKYILGIIIFGGLLLLACEYDDSNELEILRPNDSTATGRKGPKKSPLQHGGMGI